MELRCRFGQDGEIELFYTFGEGKNRSSPRGTMTVGSLLAVGDITLCNISTVVLEVKCV
jgi:hypothetical protein